MADLKGLCDGDEVLLRVELGAVVIGVDNAQDDSGGG